MPGNNNHKNSGETIMDTNTLNDHDYQIYALLRAVQQNTVIARSMYEDGTHDKRWLMDKEDELLDNAYNMLKEHLNKVGI